MDIFLDLYLASLNIGALWFGIGKVEEDTCNRLDFVIIFAIAKVADDKFRKDMFKSKQKLWKNFGGSIHTKEFTRQNPFLFKKWFRNCNFYA